MRDYEQTIRELRDSQYVYHYSRDYLKNMMDDAADAIEELSGKAGRFKWISVEEPPDNDRNIFICHGSVDFKAPCIGHYDPGVKMFYEDKNWFASPIYDAMFWCEMPKLPLLEPPKEEK